MLSDYLGLTLQNKGENMKFVWKLPKKSKPTFKDRVHNLACFEIVLNIMRMKTKAGEDSSEEMEALCGFAFECMFGQDDVNSEVFNEIMDLKDKKVNSFRSKLLIDMGIPESVMDAPEVGEA